jgi:hypothetical protein
MNFDFIVIFLTREKVRKNCIQFSFDFAKIDSWLSLLSNNV